MTTTANLFIQRPATPATGYTALPNWLLECKTYDLKPRDLAVLNYLLSKRSDWKVRISDVVKYCRISRNTVYAALKVLQARGLAWWERLSSGHVQWYLHVPDNPPVTRVVEPHPKKPHPKKPHPNFEHVLTKNNKKTITENTTTAPAENPPICEPDVVVVEKPVLPPELANVKVEFDPSVLDTFNEKEKNLANSELKKVTDRLTQAIILVMLKNAITDNKITNSPMAYLRGLVKCATKGTLDIISELRKIKKAQEQAAAQAAVAPKIPTAEELAARKQAGQAREQAIRTGLLKQALGYYQQSLEEIFATVKEKGCIALPYGGVFHRSEFVTAGFGEFVE